MQPIAECLKSIVGTGVLLVFLLTFNWSKQGVLFGVFVTAHSLDMVNLLTHLLNPCASKNCSSS